MIILLLLLRFIYPRIHVIQNNVHKFVPSHTFCVQEGSDAVYLMNIKFVCIKFTFRVKTEAAIFTETGYRAAVQDEILAIREVF